MIGETAQHLVLQELEVLDQPLETALSVGLSNRLQATIAPPKKFGFAMGGFHDTWDGRTADWQPERFKGSKTPLDREVRGAAVPWEKAYLD